MAWQPLILCCDKIFGKNALSGTAYLSVGYNGISFLISFAFWQLATGFLWRCFELWYFKPSDGRSVPSHFVRSINYRTVNKLSFPLIMSLYIFYTIHTTPQSQHFEKKKQKSVAVRSIAVNSSTRHTPNSVTCREHSHLISIFQIHISFQYQ